MRRLRVDVAVLVAALAPVLIGLTLLAGDPLRRLELDTVHLRFAVRGAQTPSTDVVLVGIDRGSLLTLRSRWPIPRQIHARAIDRLSAAGARVIAYDVDFLGDGSTPAERAASEAVLRATRRAGGRVVLATSATDVLGGASALGRDSADLAVAGTAGGFAGFPRPNGYPVARVPLEGRGPRSVAGLPSFSALVAAKAGRSPGRDAVSDGGMAWIDFAGPPRTYDALSFADLVAGRIPASRLRGRIVVVAAVDPGIKDALPTVAGGDEDMAGGEIEANAIATWLAGAPLHSAPGWLNVLFVLLLGAPPPLLALRVRPAIATAVACAAPIAFLVVAQALFQAGTVVRVLPALVASAAALLSLLIVRLRRSELERRALLRRFAEFDRSVVDEVLGGATATASGIGLAAGDVVPGYRLTDVLGRGAMGVVYRAIDQETGRPVAVKVLAPEVADDERYRRRFEQEARLTASLEHPNVLPVYAFGEHDGLVYLVSRLVEGGDLDQRLRRDGPIESDEAVRIVAAVAAALDAAHTARLVHRDVKPANILVDAGAGGHVYLGDFGVARASGGPDLTDAGTRVGTLAYSAPELLTGGPATPASDLYALGVTLYALVEGRLPFAAPTEAAIVRGILDEPPPVPVRAPELAAVLARALAKDPAQRYGDGADLVRAAGSAAAPV